MSGIVTLGYGEAAASGPAVVSVTPYVNSIVVVFDSTITLTGIAAIAANWVITGTTYDITVTSVSAVGTTVTLGITEGHNGDSATLNLPYAGIFTGTTPYADILTFPFTVVGVSPTITIANQISARVVRVVFSEVVSVTDATDVANWTMSGGYSVSEVEESVDATTYLVTVDAPLRSNTSYTVTASNIPDSAGNIT
jgi:hypothetical protein